MLALLASGQELSLYPSQRPLQGKATRHHLETQAVDQVVVAEPVLAMLGLLASGQELSLYHSQCRNRVL